MYWKVTCSETNQIFGEIYKKEGCNAADKFTGAEMPPPNKNPMEMSKAGGDGKCHADPDKVGESNTFKGCPVKEKSSAVKASVTLVVSAVALIASIFV